ncbi:hypothetical protein AAG906_032091 [Vitis piasezkii]
MPFILKEKKKIMKLKKCARISKRLRRKRVKTHITRQCQEIGCGATKTPMWRRGPQGASTLCNACGLKYWRRQRKEGEARPYLLPDLNELPELGLDLDLNQFPQP